jgi:ribosomal protein L16 Arg81 hydroxylase
MQTTTTATAAATLPASAELELLLGDFDPETFFSRHWERRSLTPERLFETEVQRCRHLKASTRDRDGWNVETRIQPEQAAKLYRAGMTICASMLEERGPIGELVAAYRRAITTAAPPHVNCYYSPDQRGYGLHFDTHPVWILQVSGSKHWTVSHEPAVRNPPFNLIFPPGRDQVRLPWITMDRPDVNDPDRFMHVRLDPGDVLYIPAGGWHAARAEGSSLALTLALGRIGTLDLFDFLLIQTAHQRLREVTGRLPPFPVSGGGGAHREEVLLRVEADLARLKAVVERIKAEDLMKVYEFHAEHPETLLATREFVTAKSQVQWMKALYHEGRTGEA